ncbi:hypothetical protein CCUS01_11549 [Colletotrichum cuscutae]|uniref:Uncharacterized protein n=1 Tax=Colletotrichum cuscutae TaxID=1209917 RepID=A0AAI9XGY3_9PEZI|nr:hypothetical protein CCUS01_11549 [Colletotrichum cuscutae]
MCRLQSRLSLLTAQLSRNGPSFHLLCLQSLSRNRRPLKWYRGSNDVPCQTPRCLDPDSFSIIALSLSLSRPSLAFHHVDAYQPLLIQTAYIPSYRRVSDATANQGYRRVRQRGSGSSMLQTTRASSGPQSRRSRERHMAFGRPPSDGPSTS